MIYVTRARGADAVVVIPPIAVVMVLGDRSSRHPWRLPAGGVDQQHSQARPKPSASSSAYSAPPRDWLDAPIAANVANAEASLRAGWSNQLIGVIERGGEGLSDQPDDT